MKQEEYTLSKLIDGDFEEDYTKFDLSEIRMVLLSLANENPIDIAHAERLQLLALRGADVVCEYIGKLIKIIGYYEAKSNSVKNKTALEFKAEDGRTTIDLRKFAAESSPEVEKVLIELAKAKGAKAVLDKKYDVLIKAHHYYKDLTNGLRRTILGYNPTDNSMQSDQTTQQEINIPPIMGANPPGKW